MQTRATHAISSRLADILKKAGMEWQVTRCSSCNSIFVGNDATDEWWSTSSSNTELHKSTNICCGFEYLFDSETEGLMGSYVDEIPPHMLVSSRYHHSSEVQPKDANGKRQVITRPGGIPLLIAEQKTLDLLYK